MLSVFDVADEADLVAVERALRSRAVANPDTVARLRLERERAMVVFSNAPVTAMLGERQLDIGDRELTMTVEAKVYDFGALTVAWTFPLPAVSLDELVALSVRLDEPALRAQIDRHMRADAEAAIDAIRAGLRTAEIQTITETLTLIAVSQFDRDVTAAELVDHPALPGLVIGEDVNFSAEVRDDVRRASFSYSDHDLVAIGYDQAFAYDLSNVGDLVALIEFALVQVLELDYYDRLLDDRLTEANDAIRARRRRARRASFDDVRDDLLAQHVDYVEVLDRVSAAVKVTDDAYYAKVYNGALRVFRAEELQQATDRKLELMFRTYSMLADESNDRKARRLEWIIIALIAFEIILALAGVFE